MRILIVHEDRREPGQAGGAESILRDHAAAMKRRGHTVSWWWGQGSIQRAVDAFKPDLLHVQTVHNFLPDWLGVMRWIQASGIPHVWVLMDYWPFCYGRMLLREWIDGETCSAGAGVCDGRCQKGRSPEEWLEVVNGSTVVTLCEPAREILLRNGVKCRFVVEPGIDIEAFHPDESARVVGSVYTSSAWASYPHKGMQVVRQAVKGRGINVQLLTGLPRERVASEIRKADVYVFPSIYEETFGLCLCEAMASGTACITTDVAGGRAQYHGGSALLIPARDPVAMRWAIEYLRAHPQEAREMGERARAHVVEHHSLDALAERWERVYAEVAACAVS